MKREDYIWSSAELKFLKDNYSRISVISITEQLPKRTYSSVRHMIRKLGLHKQFNLRKYSVNKTCFSNYSPNCCYWAGFISADGNVSDRGVLSIGLKKSDYKHLEKFNKFCEYTNTVKM